MTPDNSPMNPLLELVSDLSPIESALFALGIAYHQSPNFQLWCLMKDDRLQKVITFDKCLKYLGTMLQGGCSDKGIRSKREEVTALAEECSKDDSLGGSFASDCMNALETAYECALGEDENGCADVCMMSLTGIALRFHEDIVQQQPNDDTYEEIIKAELDFQMKLIELITKARIKRTDKKVSSTVVAGVYALVEDHGLSNIGVDFDIMDEDESED